MCWYLKEKDIVVSLYLLAMLISMCAVNITRFVWSYVKDHPLRNGASGTDARPEADNIQVGLQDDGKACAGAKSDGCACGEQLAVVPVQA